MGERGTSLTEVKKGAKAINFSFQLMSTVFYNFCNILFAINQICETILFFTTFLSSFPHKIHFLIIYLLYLLAYMYKKSWSKRNLTKDEFKIECSEIREIPNCFIHHDLIVLLLLFFKFVSSYRHLKNFRYEFVRCSPFYSSYSEKNTPEKGGTCNASIYRCNGCPNNSIYLWIVEEERLMYLYE